MLPSKAMDWTRTLARVNKCDRQVWPSGHHLTREWFRSHLPDYDFWFIWKGNGFFRAGSNPPVSLHRGVSLFLQPGEPYEAWHVDGPQLGVTWIHFDIVSSMTRGRLARGELPHYYLDSSRSEFFDGLTTRMISIQRDFTYFDPSLESRGRRLQTHLLCTLLEAYEYDLAYERTETGAGLTRHQRQIVSRALEAIHTEYRTIRSMSQLALDLGYSRDHFRKVFKATTGRNPHQALTDVRMDQAKTYLRSSELSIQAVAAEVGFESEFYFSRLFKREIGCTPSAFRHREYAHRKRDRNPQDPRNPR